MPLSRPARSASLAIALPVWMRWIGHKYALPLLFIAACAVMAMGQSQKAELAYLRARAMQALVPVWQTLAAPGQAVADLGQTLSNWRDTYRDNTRLRADNMALLQWRDAAQRLAAENKQLAKLSQFIAPPQAKAVTARVVADISGPYQNALLVLAGADDGITDGAVALGQTGGVIGRVTELGASSARVLLLTDPGARIPVRLEQSGAAAIASGTGYQGSDTAIDLLYLPADVSPQMGERVVTSGHGGIFPVGLPVGTITLDADNRPHVTPLDADIKNSGTPEIVRIVDYRLPLPGVK